MDEPRNLGLAAALAGGYLLGRAKKNQMALTAAAVLAGRGLRPGSALAAGARRVPGLPGSKDDGGDGDDGGEQGSGSPRRGLARKAADRGVNALTEALRQRTRSLSPEGADEQENPPEEDDGDSEDADEDAVAEEDEDAEEDEAVAPRRPAGRPGKKSAKTPKAKKPAAGKPAARKARESAEDEPAPAKKPKKRAASAKPPAGRSGAAGKAAPKAKPAARGRPAKKTAARSKRDR
ncbi:hypothetical protein [Streptomyces sp. NPDC049040]|uniref:hypothetical protein n=1 Tax=Streptomyces sp. NPDC049040 TaxID=3365593 RepID=UPI00371CA3EA